MIYVYLRFFFPFSAGEGRFPVLVPSVVVLSGSKHSSCEVARGIPLPREAPFREGQDGLLLAILREVVQRRPGMVPHQNEGEEGTQSAGQNLAGDEIPTVFDREPCSYQKSREFFTFFRLHLEC